MASSPRTRRLENDGEPRRAILVHAPTICVSLLRQAAGVLEKASEILPKETVFFPRKEASERPPIELAGRVSLDDLAGLVHYLSDMLEV